MELLQLSSKKIKFAIMGVLFVLIIGNISPVYAVIYHFDDDFSGGPDEGWQFSAWLYPLTGSYIQGTHTFTFDGELISDGEPNGRISNYAWKNDTTTFGAWSFDIFIPTNPLNNVWDASFTIDWDYLKPASYFGEANAADWPEFNLDGVGEGLRFEAWNKERDPSSDRLKFEQTSSGLKFDVYQHFDVIRTQDNFYVYIDGDLIMDTDFSSTIAPEINYFDLNTAQGSGVKFDNIKITTDAQGVLDSLLPVSDSTSVSESSSESDNNSVFLAVGSGSVALFGTVSYWRLSKKKT